MASLGCGPVAVSLITGVPAEDVCKALAESGHDGRDGTKAEDLRKVFTHFEHMMCPVKCWPERLSGPLVADWLAGRVGAARSSLHLLLVEDPGREGYHWVAVKGGEFGDRMATDSKWAPYPAQDFEGWRVREVYGVTPWEAIRYV
jgi:hypothetical protein